MNDPSLMQDVERFTLHLPDGRQLEGPALADGATWAIDHYGLRQIEVQEVGGPWAAALTEYAGRPLRLVRCLSSGGAIDVFPLTFTTTGSLRQLAREVGAAVDATRFRAGMVLDYPEPYAEDAWDGRHLRIGTVLLRVRTAVPRCGVIGLNPASGVRDQDVMRSLILTRPKTGLPDGLLPGYATPGFATYAEVLEPGEVAVGAALPLRPPRCSLLLARSCWTLPTWPCAAPLPACATLARGCLQSLACGPSTTAPAGAAAAGRTWR
jgi:hypothetical protein